MFLSNSVDMMKNLQRQLLNMKIGEGGNMLKQKTTVLFYYQETMIRMESGLQALAQSKVQGWYS